MNESIENRIFLVKVELDRLDPSSDKDRLKQMIRELDAIVKNLDSAIQNAIQSGNRLVIIDGCDFHWSLIHLIEAMKEEVGRRFNSQHWQGVINAVNNLIAESRKHYDLDAYSNRYRRPNTPTRFMQN